jgi:DNA-binding CsgD family transcriptional regulator
MAGMEGKFKEFEGLLSQARDAALRLSTEAAHAYYFPLAAAAWIDETRSSEIEGFLLEFCRRIPGTYSHTFLMNLYLRLEDSMKLRSEYVLAAAHDFADVRDGIETDGVLAPLAESCARLGDTQRATFLYERCLVARGKIMVGPPACIFGPVDRYLGLLAAVMRRWDNAVSHFEVALEVCRSTGARPYSVLTQLDYAQMLLARGSRSDIAEITDLLTRAEEEAAVLGMERAGRRCSSLLGTIGAKAGAFPDGLTRREIEVLRRLAAGESDREIAAALTVSAHTVERHVANIYAKTGLHNRAQATRYAIEKGLALSSAGRLPT